MLVTARLGNAGGITIGLADGETLVASDLPAVLDHTRRMVFLDDGEMAVVTRRRRDLAELDGKPVEKQPTTVAWDPVSAAKGGYRHFMLKEIHEQPRSLADTIRSRISLDPPARLPRGPQRSDDASCARVKRIVLIGCGTAWHAGLCAKFMIEELARVPCEVDYADEFRYRDPVVDAEHAADRGHASRARRSTCWSSMARRAGAARGCSRSCNAVGSQASRGAPTG